MGIRDDQWDRIKDMLPGRAGHVGVTARNNRLFIDAVLYRYRTGIPWRDLPEKYGDFRNVHRRFSRWAEKGIWAKLLSVLTQEADTEYVMIDSTVVRAHQHSAGAAIRTNRPVTGWIIDPRCDRRPSDPVSAGPGARGSDVLLTDLSAGAVIADKTLTTGSFSL
jgi:transposase